VSYHVLVLVGSVPARRSRAEMIQPPAASFPRRTQPRPAQGRTWRRLRHRRNALRGHASRAFRPVLRANQSNWLTLPVGTQRLCISRARLYDPELAIFLSRDFLPYPNKYRAWSNSPVGQVDRDGLEDEDPVHAGVGKFVDVFVKTPLDYWLPRTVVPVIEKGVKPAAAWVTKNVVAPVGDFAHEHGDYIAGGAFVVGSAATITFTGGMSIPALLTALGFSAKVVGAYETGLICVGIYETGKSGYETVTGREAWTGNPLSEFQKGGSHAGLALGIAGFAKGGLSLFRGGEINLGSGRNPMPGAVNIDKLPYPGVDAVVDVKDLPTVFGPDRFTGASAINPRGFQPVSPEVAEVLKPGSELRVTGQYLNPDVFSQEGVARFEVPANPAPALTPGEISRAGFEFRGIESVDRAHTFGAPKTAQGRDIDLSMARTLVYIVKDKSGRAFFVIVTVNECKCPKR
jgi:hypothetical protein